LPISSPIFIFQTSFLIVEEIAFFFLLLSLLLLLEIDFVSSKSSLNIKLILVLSSISFLFLIGF